MANYLLAEATSTDSSAALITIVKKKMVVMMKKEQIRRMNRKLRMINSCPKSCKRKSEI